MTEDDALHIKQGSAWQLLLKFLTPGGAAGEDKAAQRITEGVGELGLQSVQKERIERAVAEAVRKAIQRDMRDQHNSPACIRVWVWGPSTAEAGSSADARRVNSQKRRGWGFFLLERQEGDPQAKEIESHRVIELYLYQETAHVK